tara:strand:+ start:1387 stop:2349 length:963 start_codon:yes stop_codon:yes gene_type:complete
MNNYFINKYKPTKIQDFILDNDVKFLITNLIEMDSLNLIIHGEPGSGKTSLVNAIINEYYDDCVNINENVLYLNNLKDQGIQYYRSEVKTFCQTKNNLNKKKFIVIDDVDCIPEQSQQVFRNCIDKYSNNVFFLCSCNNLQKVIDSLQSRQIIIKLKKHSINDCTIIMNNIIKKENIKIDNFSKEIILKLSNNSIRILLNYLEKVKLLNIPITKNIIDKIGSNISYYIFDEYTNCIQSDNLNDAIKIFNELYNDGYSVMDIYDNYFHYIKLISILDENEKYKIIDLLCKYITIFHNIHEDEIELALFTNEIYKLLNNICS